MFSRLLLLLLFSQSASAALTKYKPVEFSAEKIRKVFITGFIGNIKMVGVDNSKTVSMKVSQETAENASSIVKSTQDQWIFSYKQVGEDLLIKVTSPQDKEDWERLLASQLKGIPEYHLTINMPSRPLELNWRQGTIELESWTQSLSMTLDNGSVLYKDIAAEGKVFLQSGKFKVVNYAGDLSLDLYDVDLDIDKYKGHLRGENFFGSSSIENFEGAINITSFKGDSRLSNGKGQIDFKNGRSNFKLSHFSGDLRGKSAQGAVSGQFDGPVNIRVSSEDGPVSFKLPNSGAYVNLGSREGGLYAPKFLKVDRWPNIKTVTGQLRGKHRGSVYVRTNKGAVSLQ